MLIDTPYRIMLVGLSVGHNVKTTFPNMKICMKMQLFMIILQIMMIMMVLLIMMIFLIMIILLQ